MRNTICKLIACLVATMAATFPAFGAVNSKALRVDSVTVDSVWNSDSSFHDGSGILQQRTSRDLRLSFTIRADSVWLDSIAFLISFDSGHTWNTAPNLLRLVGDATGILASVNTRASVILRVLGGDRANTVLKVYVRGSDFALEPIPDKKVDFVNSSATYQNLSFTVRATGTGSTTYQVRGKPDGATFDPVTGVFSWTPTVVDFGAHLLTFVASFGSFNVADTMTITVPKPALPQGAVFKMVSPNGGETYSYGDTITCIWLQDPTVCQNGMLRVNNGPVSCDYFNTETPYLKAAVDTSAAVIAAGDRYFLAADTHTYVAVCRVIMIDRPKSFSGCGATFSGSEMTFDAYDLYGPADCTNCHDPSDATFTVVK